MPAATLNLTDNFRVEQGAHHVFTVTITNESGTVYDMTGASAAAQIRETKDASTSYAYTCSINTTTGVITLTMTNETTDDITFETGYWDLELTESTGRVVRLLEGTVEISLETTKAA